MSLRLEIITILKGLAEPATTAEIATLLGDGTTAAEVTCEVARMLRNDPPLLRRVHNPRGFLKYTLRSRLDADLEESHAHGEAESVASDSENAITAVTQEAPATAERPRANASSWHATTTKYGGKTKRVYDIVARAGKPISASDIALALDDGTTSKRVGNLLWVLRKNGQVVCIGASKNCRWIVAPEAVNAVAASPVLAATPRPPAPVVQPDIAQATSAEPDSKASSALSALRLNVSAAEDAVESYVHSCVDEDVYRSLCMSRYHARAALERHTAGGRP